MFAVYCLPLRTLRPCSFFWVALTRQGAPLACPRATTGQEASWGLGVASPYWCSFPLLGGLHLIL